MIRSSLLAVLLLLAAPLPAAAQDPAQSVVAQLRDQGYVSFEVSRTLLGRVRVLATRPEGTREIVFNPATGEILRDLWEPSGSGSAAPRVLDREDDDPARPSQGQGQGGGVSGGDDDGHDNGHGGGNAGGNGGGNGGGSGRDGEDDGEDGGDRGGDHGGGAGDDRGHGNDDDGDDEDNPGHGRDHDDDARDDDRDDD